MKILVNLRMNLEEIFEVDKPIIGMLHLPPLPGSPRYDYNKDMDKLVERALKDVKALMSGGVDGILISNESDVPYLLKVGPETIASFTYIVSRLKDELTIPFGIDVLWGDAKASFAIAKAVGASFVRTLLTGVHAGDLGLINTHGAEVMRYKRFIGAENIKTFIYLNPELSAPLSNRPLHVVAMTVSWLSIADAFCISGPMPGMPPDLDVINKIRDKVPNVAIIANTGMNKENISKYLEVVDGAIVGTAFKVGGITLNPVDERRVKEFMEVVKRLRKRY